MATPVSTDLAPEPSAAAAHFTEDAAFAALEARVLAVAEALRQTRAERDQAHAQREQAQAELAQLHHAHAQAERELVSLRKERNEVRQRVSKLVAQLEASLT